MKYCEQASNSYIIVIGTGTGNTKIPKSEYNEIIVAIQNHPQSDGKGYRLKTDLTWEEYDLPPEPEPSDEDELSNDEALNIILGGTIK